MALRGADGSSECICNHKITLLGLPAELRNAIYEYTFAVEIKSRPTPHPLTQVSSQIRKESLKLYYESVTYLRLSVRTLEQLARARKWLAEVDLTVYPTLPTFAFSFPWSDHPDSDVYWTRTKISLAQELPKYVSFASAIYEQCPNSGYIHDKALGALYLDCLGVDYRGRALRLEDIKPCPQHFTQLVEEGGTWITRRMHREGAGPGRLTMCFRNETASLSNKLVDVARLKKEGRDWDKSDLGKILDLFENDLLVMAGKLSYDRALLRVFSPPMPHWGRSQTGAMQVCKKRNFLR